MKHYVSLELMIDGSIQDTMTLSRAELRRLSEALGQAVPNYDGTDRVPMLKLMRKIDRLLSRFEAEVGPSLSELKGGPR